MLNLISDQYYSMDTEDFNHCLLKHEKSLKNYAFTLTGNSQDAEDLLHDTYLRAFIYQKKFDDKTNVRAWTFTIMKNIFINAYRRSVRKTAMMKNSIDGEPFYAHSATAVIEEYLVLEDIGKAINELRSDYTLCFQRFCEGYKYKEIAEQMNIPIGNIKTNIHMARKKLKIQLSL